MRHLGCIAVFVVVVFARPALAGDFQVEPTRLDLARRGATTELAISNRGHAVARFEAKAYVWSQDEHGVMQLAATTDVVVYPTLFALDAGAKRSIRIAITAPPGATEQSYRVFVEELPPPRGHVAEGKPATIAVLARIGVPVFLAPTKATVSGTIVGSASTGTVRFALENHGSVHVKVATVRVIGTDRAGHVVVDRTQASWYLLAGGKRDHELALDASTCGSIDHVVLEAITDRGSWHASFAMPAEGCKSLP
jgi:fimbrial chaperone protein